MEKIKGRVLLLGNDVDTDQILPGYAMAEPQDQLGQYALAGVPGLNYSQRMDKGNIIVAGRNFGCGSSREQAPIALKQSGIRLIIAKSFARIFRRNAINIGLPVLMADVHSLLQNGDEIEVDLVKGEILTPKGLVIVQPVAENTLKTLEYGGLIPRVRAELNIKKG